MWGYWFWKTNKKYLFWKITNFVICNLFIAKFFIDVTTIDYSCYFSIFYLDRINKTGKSDLTYDYLRLI